MDGKELEIISRSKGVANGVQNSYADALKGTRPDDESRPPPSIGYQCPVYADVPGMQPAPPGAGDTTINVGGKKRIHD
jgi:hypothetical protein